MPYTIQILGNVQSGRTEAEIVSSDASGAERVWGVVFDSPDGWVITIAHSGPSLPLAAAIEALHAAQERLKHYVNRRGDNVPEGLTAAGFSLWLLEKDDGTAMGRPIG